MVAPAGASGPPRLRVPLLATAGGTAAVSAVLYGLAVTESYRFNDPSTPCDELGGIRDRTNLLVVGSGITASVALGAGITAIFVEF